MDDHWKRLGWPGLVGALAAIMGVLMLHDIFTHLHWPEWPRFETPSGYNFFPFVLATGTVLPLVLCIAALLVSWLMRLLPHSLSLPVLLIFRYQLRAGIPFFTVPALIVALVEIVWRIWDL